MVELEEKGFPDNSANFRVLWAKSSPRHPLWKHLLDLAAVDDQTHLFPLHVQVPRKTVAIPHPSARGKVN
ncbi:MAG: hypothetical protein QUS11_05855 [Candidatus Fermentibacter sp.]|nr:hypothetical protein [Candidatus Fermentibacter sp.]